MANGKQEWYENIIRKGSLRNSGMDEITETNPLDWQRLRILENGKFVPAMAAGHSGAPGIIDLDLLYDAAKKGNLFLYRLGEEYPHRLDGDVWYSTDPAVAEEKRPELQQDDAEKLQAWEKRTGFYNNLSTEVKRAIRDEMAPRREEIRRDQEKQRAADIDIQPLINWYNEWHKKDLSEAAFQPGKGPAAVGKAMDWSQVRIWDGESFTPAMPEGHRGEPDIQGMEKLRDAVEKGNLFFYKAGDEYPQRLENGTWYDTSPLAMQEAKPELQLPQAPADLEPFAATLADELKARKLSPEAKLEDLQTEKERNLYLEAAIALADKETAYQATQQAHQAEKERHAKECARLEEEHRAKVQAWEKRVGFYDNLDAGLKQSIQNGVAQRRVEIRAQQERQHAAMNSQPLGSWYNNKFRKSIVQPSSDPNLMATDGIDWSRVRIWDGQKFARAVPEGHKGVPDDQILQNLRDAAEKGNLFMYQRGDKYPSKWTGTYWSSMDRNWIESCRPKDPPGKPVVPEMRAEPSLEEAVRGISNVRLGINRIFARMRINVYKSEAERYEQAVANYEREKAAVKEQNDRAMADYNRKLEAYNNEAEGQKNYYDKQLDAYQRMLKNYEGLTPEQRAAMEKDVQQRTEEIKANKEIEKKIAEEKLARERDTKVKIADAEARINAMENQPDQEKFLNQGGEPLGKKVYDTVAPHGYVLPVDSKITPQEAAAIHIVLAGSQQAAADGNLSPLNAQQYGQMLDGVLYGDPNTVNWQYITASYDAAQGYIAAFERGNPEPLAKALSEGVRNLMNVSKGRLGMTPEMAGFAKLTGRILDMMDTHKELMEKCTLNQEEMNFARGIVNLGRIYSNYIDARMELTMMSAGAQPVSKEKVSEHTANILIGKMTESRLQQEQKGLAEPKMLEALGKGNGRAMDIVRFAYRNNPDIQNFANDPQTLQQTDLDKRTQRMAKLFGTTVLVNPKTSPEIKEQVTTQVKKQIEQNSPEAVEKRRLAEQKDMKERQQVRDLLAGQDPFYEKVSLQSNFVTEKLNELRTAREALETQDSRVGKNNPYELTDPRVQLEAQERASVRELMQQEAAEQRAAGKKVPDINDFTVGRRLTELRAAQKQLSGADRAYELTSPEVVAKAAQNREARADRLRQPIKDLLLAQQIYTEETGVAPEPNQNPPFYRSKVVQDRLDRLIAARKRLGEAGRDLPINDMKVIQEDYRQKGIDPLQNGIVDVESLTEMQRKDYFRRMETIEFLQNVRGVEGLYKNTSRYHNRVNNAMSNLNRVRETYELFVQGSEKDLPLNHPKITAMYLYDLVSQDSSLVKKVKFDDVAKLAQDIQGKNLSEMQAAARLQLLEVQTRNQQAQMVNQEQQQQMAQPQPPAHVP